MVLRTASPWWFTATLVFGLLLVFLGERPFSHLETVRLLFTGIGGLSCLGVSFLRVWTFLGSRGARRSVERVFVLCHIGVAVGLLIYVATTDFGHGLLGVDGWSAEAQQRFQVPMQVLYSIVFLVSLIPLIVVETSLGTAMRTRFSPADLKGDDGKSAGVELFRVRELAASGLTMALAASFLMVTCNVAQERNVRKNVSYFKTSSPGTSTVAAVKESSVPLNVYLFFPDPNAVKEEIRGYFEELKDSTGNVNIETHDPRVAATLAGELGVSANMADVKKGRGTIVIEQRIPATEEGNDDTVKRERITVPLDINIAKRARNKQLRNFDRDVNAALMKVITSAGTAYLTVGHGEINDPESLGPMKARFPDARAAVVKETLRNQNYTVKDLGLAQGLGNEIPEDASLVLMLYPRSPLQDEELEALGRYLDRGGSLLVALDPMGEAELGPLASRLGVTFVADEITDDKEHIAQSRNVSDRRLALTNQFSAHASTSTLGRGRARSGILLVNSGHLVDHEFQTSGDGVPKRTYVIRSMSTSWADTNDNFSFEEGEEKRDRYNIAAAIEGPEPPEGENRMRAMVFADGDLFADPVQRRVPLAARLFEDAVKWLAGREHLAGEVVSEEDLVIEHTRSEDVLWFYAMVVGAPLLVLGLGLAVVWFRRRKSGRAA